MFFTFNVKLKLYETEYNVRVKAETIHDAKERAKQIIIDNIIIEDFKIETNEIPMNKIVEK